MIWPRSKFSITHPVTTATGAIPVLRDRTVFSTNVIPFAVEIVRVTGRTIRSVLRPPIWNRCADGITVARIATRIPSVIAWVVALRVMAEVGRRPAIGGMTNVTLRGCQ